MSAKSATLAKSLHTVSVLVNVARLELTLAAAENYPMLPADAVAAALRTLGYAGASDPYGLAAKAVDVLRKEAAKAAAARPTRPMSGAAAYDAGRL